MAYFFNTGEKNRQVQFVCDTEADIAGLPTSVTEGSPSVAVGNAYQRIAIGSIALCIDTGDLYVLDTNNTWSKLGTQNYGGVPGESGSSDEGSGSGSSDEGSGSGSSDEGSETGGGCFKVNFTQNSVYDVGWRSDKSMAQIIEAYEAGMLIYAELTTPFFDQKSVGILDTLDYSGDSNSPYILCRFKIGMLNSYYNGNNGESLLDEFVMWKILKPKDNEEIIEY